MNQVVALSKIIGLGQSLFETRDLAALLQKKPSAASLTASRLVKPGLLTKFGRGKWGLTGKVDRLTLPEHLTAPFPSYISLQSALFHHGMIQQVPQVIYAVSLAKTRRHRTPLGTVSIHHVNPSFFFGYELNSTGSAKIATPEKALADFFYFAPTRTRLFRALPEIEFPPDFNWKEVFANIAKIKSPTRRIFVQRRLAILEGIARRETRR
jgi:predicted transcriptional regulator of viral defense system